MYPVQFKLDAQTNDLSLFSPLLQLIRTTYWTRFNRQIREDEKGHMDFEVTPMKEKPKVVRCLSMSGQCCKGKTKEKEWFRV
jgi:hypothetical protein